MAERDPTHDDDSLNRRARRSIILGPSPFDLMAIGMLLLVIATPLLLPVIQWIRVLLR
jgi:hypothetical protein